MAGLSQLLYSGGALQAQVLMQMPEGGGAWCVSEGSRDWDSRPTVSVISQFCARTKSSHLPRPCPPRSLLALKSSGLRFLWWETRTCCSCFTSRRPGGGEAETFSKGSCSLPVPAPSRCLGPQRWPTPCLDQGAQLVGVVSYSPKACAFDSWSGCAPGLAGLISGRRVYRRQLINVSLSQRCFLSLSLSLCLKSIKMYLQLRIFLKKVFHARGKREGRKTSCIPVYRGGASRT